MTCFCYLTPPLRFPQGVVHHVQILIVMSAFSVMVSTLSSCRSPHQTVVKCVHINTGTLLVLSPQFLFDGSL